MKLNVLTKSKETLSTVFCGLSGIAMESVVLTEDVMLSRRSIIGFGNIQTNRMKKLWAFNSVACVQTSPISFHPRKRDVCETASLMVFQYPAVFSGIRGKCFYWLLDNSHC